MLTRRATRRRWLLRPDANGRSQQIYLYTLGYNANEHGILVHNLCQMSSHDHETITDVLGTLPLFLRGFHRDLANAMKCHRGWSGEFYDKNQTSRVELTSPAAVLEEMAYVLVNPTDSGGVWDYEAWPGVTVKCNEIGEKVFAVKRPEVYFDPNNKEKNWPDEIELRIVMPETLLREYGGLKEAQQALKSRCEVLADKARTERRKLGLAFGTPASAVQSKFTRRSSSYEVFGALRPTFATGGEPEAAEQAREARAQFLSEYVSYRVPGPSPGTHSCVRTLIRGVNLQPACVSVHRFSIPRHAPIPYPASPAAPADATVSDFAPATMDGSPSADLPPRAVQSVAGGCRRKTHLHTLWRRRA